MNPTLIGTGLQLGAGIGTMVSGAIDKRNAKKAEQALGARPVYNIPEPTLKNQFMAENLAQQGLSDESRMMYEQQANRGLSDSIDALLKVGGGINSVSDLYANYQDKGIELANLNDQIKFRNQQVLANQNSQMADELDKQWQLNTFDPWKDEKQKIADLRTMGDSKIMGGVSMLSQVGGMMSTQRQNSNGDNTQSQTQQRTTQGNQQNAMDSERGVYDQMYRKPTSQQYFQNNGQDANINTNYYLQSLMG